MTDIRKKYILNITGIYFNANSYENDDNVLGQIKLEQFLDNEQCVTLCATCPSSDNNSQIEFHNEVVPFVNRMVIFFKNRQSRLNETNVYEIVQLVVLQGSTTASLYHTLHNVFTPLLLQEGKKSNAVNLNLQRQLTTFQTSLRSAASVADGDGSNLSENNSLSVISTLEHEVEYWNSLANSAKNADIKNSSLAYRDMLKPLARDFSMLDALPLLEIEDALEGAHNVLDDLWRHDPPYRRTRMQHLMDLVASDVIHCITRQLSNIKIWEDDYTDVTDLLEQSISAGKKWNSACTHLTQLFWPNYSLHPWTGDSYTPQNLVDLVTRLEDVLNLRAIHRQLTRLLNHNETEDLQTSEMFKPFANLNSLQCGPYSENSWKTAVKQFEYLLLPAEQRVGEKLKVQLANVSNNTRQLLYEFTRYCQLMDRPVVRKILLAERQNLLSSLGQYIKHLSGLIINESSYSKSDTPRVIIEISNVRQLESKGQVVQQTAEKLLNDLPGYEELQGQVNEFLKELKVQHSELFDSWTRELTVQINNKSLSLKESDPVVQFSSAQLMRVNYSPRLVSLVHEYRQLCAMGYRIPTHISQTAAHAKQFMKYARALEQVANFHNTIGDRMVGAQRPMMLAGALELSRLVQQEEVVSWGDVRSVEKYVESLRKAVNRLSRENNLLATYHMQMLDKIKELSDVDLIRHLQKWKDNAKYLRDVMNQVEQQGFTNMQSWKLEIDRSLSTEFEKQYRQSLETVHLHLPEVYADLVYRDSRLQFNPSEDKLREKYQYQLKRFLDLPRSFRGVSDITEGSVFTEIIERCKDLYAQTEKHTEELFERLKGVVEHWQSWLSLGVLDTSQLATWQHWDLNFRASKTFGQEVAKLPSTEERVGCFVISLSCLRSDLESHNRSYWSQLMSSLQDSIAQDVVRLQQYVNSSTATLTKQPLTMEQIGQAHASHSDILKQMPEMQKLFEEMVDKNKTLASWTRERVESVARLQTAWERLQSLVDNHQHLISKQVEAFQSTINRTCENLNNEIERFSLHWDQFKPRPGSGQIANDSLKNLENYLVTMKDKKAQWDELVKQKDKVLSDCEQFGMDPPEFALCEQVQTDIAQEERVWVLFEEFNADLEKLSKEEWIVFRKRSYKLEEFVSDWQKRLESSQSTALSTRLLQELQKYEDVVPVLKYLRGEDFTEKHWMEVFSLLGIPHKPVDTLTLYDFLEVSSKVSESVTELQAICKRAASEVVVRQALAELDQWEVQSRFLLTEHQDSQKHTVMLVKDFKDILNKIGDNQSLLQSVKNSADYESFSERAGLWETRLADLDHFLVSLSQIQRKWVYLEPIFGSGTLRQERGRFDRLDRDFRHVLSSIERDSRVTSLARYPNIRVILDTLQDQLSRCQNSLDNFLSEKRLKFPRFLFLGDDDLLEILGQSSREQVIQAHLKKLFSGIHTVKMSADTKEIIAMCSLQGEVVPLVKPVNIDCPVEDWLNDLVSQMQNTLRQLLKQCLIDSLQSGPDPLQYPSQVLCLSDSITFTTRCEQAIKSATLPPLLATYKNQLKSYSLFELTNEDPSGPSSESRDENVLELKLKALMLDTIQHIDVVDELIDNNVTSLNDWHWQKQLRFYNSSNESVSVHMANAQMNYSFEYLGNASKLVRTPLTDKCFLTLTQGMHLGMGGNPYGPAGTGKTESVKALGSLLGRQVLVFNCDEGVDATSMGRILSGLVRSGAWGCFDEFNRLDEATLSAVSMHIQPIQVALRTGRKTLTLLDQQMEINPHCGIFVTLNPVGGGYKGRNRLPDNLKQLFRPVVMSHPDHEQITKTLLRCDGYQNADLIGKKLVEVFSMANELLSKQQHYDWGLRALKTVIGGCGTALNRIRRTKDYLINSNITNAEDDILKREMQLVVEALRVNTLSKLTYADSERFDSLVSDVFVGVPFQNTGHEKLVAALEESCAELGFQVNDRQISKCVELYEQLQQRMGVTIVGPSGSGKSTLRKLLLRALNKMSKSVTQHVFNPKAMTRAQLLGQIDLDTRQWTDGVLTLYALQVYAEPNEVWSWVVCDGDIDPEWVESLNSVLDDNRLLTLPSGWRIQFGPNVNFLFETHDLSYASPATVSRMGIVFLSEEDVKLGDIVNNWLSWQPEDTLRISTHLLNDYFFKAIDWIKTEGDLVIPCSNVSIVQTGLSQLRKISSKTQFTVAIIAGLGGLLNQQTRETFAQKVFEWTGEHCPDEKSILRCLYNTNRDVIDIYYSDTNYQILDTNLNDLPLVLTGQVLQTLDILKPWLSVGTEEHFLLIGPHGAAKSLLINHLVREQHNMDIATIYCSNNIMPQYVLHKLTQHCMVVSSNRGRVYRPKKGRLVLYFKGLHLLKPDKWGTNILIAFLHQLITYGGLFDSNLEWVGLESVTIVGSLSSTDNISTRFTSVMKIHNIDLPEREDLNIIYESYMTALIKSSLANNSVWAVKSKIAKLVFTLIAIYEEIKNTFTVMQQRHYIFSPHDLTTWCTNLIRYKSILSANASDTENTMLEILIYEAFRIFYDKLVNDDDRVKFDSLVGKTFQLQWGKSTLLSNLNGVYYVPSEQYNNNKSQEILSLTRLNSDDWTSLVKKGILHFGREGQTLDLLIISELLSLTSSIARSLSQNGGCVLLAGRSGVGRHSSVRVVSALQSAKLITPIYGTIAQFKNDLKSAMQIAGVEGEQVYFMLEDHMMRKSVVVDLINTLLAAGEVIILYYTGRLRTSVTNIHSFLVSKIQEIPGLHTSAELDSLAAGLKDEADRENFEGNHIQYFVQRVRSNLHLVICLEVDSSEFWRVLENCPILYQRCTVIWQSEWSSDSMTKIPNLLLQKLSENGSEDGIITEMPKGFYDIHKQAVTSLSTPRRYISLINSYLNLYTEKKKVIQHRQTKLQAGITKLTEAQNVVADLKVKALEQQKILAEKQSKANSALDMISATMKNANVHKQEMETLKEQTEKENQQLIKRKKAIEVELAEVEPILQEARAAVGNIKPEALSEIRSLRAPPDIIRDILEGVLRLMGTQDTSWNSMKTFLAKRGVREDIRSFDASKINPDNRQAVERLISTRSDSFDPKAARRASIAAAPLASWVVANVKFSQVVEKIRPLEREQYKLQQNLQNAEAQIGELSAGLSDVDAKVAQLKVQLSTYTKEAAEIEINLKIAEDKLHAAEGLVNKLNEEYDRWKTQLKELSDDLNDLPIKCLLAAAYISYLSGEFESERKKQIEDWCNVLVGGKYDFSFEEFLSSEREQLQWQTEGLLSDMLSIHNAIVILKTNINVLLLDPSSLALQWLRTHCKHRTVEIVTQNAPRFTNSLELAVRFGKVLIIEEVDNIPPILFPILRKEFVYQGTRRLVLLGNKLVDYHNDFSLYLSSRNLFVNIPPDASAVLSIVNFTTTKAGLTEQLLSGAIRQEYPQLEAKRNELLQRQEELQEQQYHLQNQLLEELANATGDILQNKQLLASLNETKASSVAITTSLKESTKIQEQLKTECDVLRPLSSFGSLLYFATTDLVRLNVMYSISISAFIKLFLKAISTTNNAQDDYTQVQKVLLQSVYSYVSRGMFKSDRLLFALYLCKHMFPEKISNEEWNLFLGLTKLSKTDTSTNTDGPPSWTSEQFMHNVVNLQNALPNLYTNLKLEDYNSWEKFVKSRECEKYFPSSCNLTEFQQVLIVQMLRPDRLYTVMNKCVLHLTGMKNLSPRVLYLSQLFKETVPSEPVLLITAPGADPSSELRDLAGTLIGIDKYKEVAMGEGQESLALQSLEDSAKLGHWLCLKNLHLVTAWSSLLSQKIQTLNPHENFRLWLVTELHPLFSSVLIQSCTKLAYEAPPGIKNNLMRSYATWGKNYIQKQNATGARLLFVLAYVHALLQERRTYIPQGWTKWYEFSDVDLYTAANLSEEIWGTKNGSVLWNHIRGLCSDAVYGGRIDERQDERVLLAYLKQNFVDIVLGHKWKLSGMNTSFPNNSNYQDYIDCINQLSDDDDLSYFGLPANIDRAWEINSSIKLISNLKVIRLPLKNSSKIERDDWNRGLSPLLSYWKKLNKGQDWLRVSIPKASNAENPVSTYMAEEKRFSIELIQNIHRSLISISKITRGTALPTDKDIEIVNSLLAYQTPYEWISFWEGPTEPFKYLQTVIDKALAVSKWVIENDSQEMLLNSTINLSSMFRPKVFLVALKQHTSRLTKVAANDLHLINSWQKSLQSPGNVTLIGIYIEGALFDGQKLTQCSSDSENVTSAPTCSIAWVPKKSFDRNENNLKVPLYSSSRREELLTTMLLPSDKKTHDQWVLAGISLFMEY